MSISIVLPIFNEEKSLYHTVKTWGLFLKKNKIDHEFLLCVDGSTDDTKNIIKKIMKEFPSLDLSTEKRRGYGGGVLAGLNAAKKKYILCIDSDGQCMPDSFLEIYKIKDDYDIVIGWRHPRNDPLIRKVYSKFFFTLFKLLFKTRIHDPSCPYVLGKKEIFLELIPYLSYLKEGFWWGFIGACIKKNKNIHECKISHYERYDGSTVVYKPLKMPSIIIRNIIGLIKLKLSV